MFKQEVIELKARAFDAQLSPAHMRVAAHVAGLLANSSGGFVAVKVSDVSDALDVSRETVSKALSKMDRLNVIEWRSSQGNVSRSVASFVSGGAL